MFLFVSHDAYVYSVLDAIACNVTFVSCCQQILVVFYLTVILLLFGNNLSCPRNLFSRSETIATRIQDTGLGQVCKTENGDGVLSQNNRNKCFSDSETLSNLGTEGNAHRDAPKGASTAKNSVALYIDKNKNGGPNYKYCLLDSADQLGQSGNIYEDDIDDIEDSEEEEEDDPESESEFVVDKKGEYSLSYYKKQLYSEKPCDYYHSNMHVHYTNCSNCSCANSCVPSSSLRDDSKLCSNNPSFLRPDQYTIRQQKLHYIEQQLRAQNLQPNGDRVEICECMRGLAHSGNFSSYNRASTTAEVECAPAMVHPSKNHPNKQSSINLNSSYTDSARDSNISSCGIPACRSNGFAIRTKYRSETSFPGNYYPFAKECTACSRSTKSLNQKSITSQFSCECSYCKYDGRFTQYKSHLPEYCTICPSKTVAKCDQIKLHQNEIVSQERHPNGEMKSFKLDDQLERPSLSAGRESLPPPGQCEICRQVSGESSPPPQPKITALPSKNAEVLPSEKENNSSNEDETQASESKLSMKEEAEKTVEEKLHVVYDEGQFDSCTENNKLYADSDSAELKTSIS